MLITVGEIKKSRAYFLCKRKEKNKKQAKNPMGYMFFKGEGNLMIILVRKPMNVNWAVE